MDLRAKQPLHPADERVATSLEFLRDAIQTQLQDTAGETYGFILMTMPFNRLGAVFHVGNVSNDQVIAFLRNHANMLESLGANNG